MKLSDQTKYGALWTSLLCGLFAISFSGCTSSTETAEEHHHDHRHRPESYGAAIAQIKHARDEVKMAFDAGKPQDCDEALHEVAEVLDVLPEVAAETDLPKEEWQVVKDQSKVLFEQFMKIHDGFHGDGSKAGASFDSVSDVVNGAIEVLESKLAATGEKVDLEESEHDEHDHEHGHDEHAHEDDHGEHDEHDSHDEAH